MIPGLQNMEYEDRLRSLRLPTLAYGRYRGDMIEMFKLTHKDLKNGYDPEAVEDFLDTRSTRTRNHPYSVCKLGFKHEFRRYSFRLRVTDQWNNLPKHVVMAGSVNTFKNRLDKVWLSSNNAQLVYNPDVNVHEVAAARQTRYVNVFSESDQELESDLMLEA